MQLNSCAQARGNKPWLAPQIVKVMKLTALLITIACLHVSAKVFSQISLSGKNVALSAVFTTIQKQSGYAFFYKDKIVENIKVNPDLHNVTLEQALDQVLKDLPLTYNIVDKTVVIKQAESSFFDNLKNKIKTELAQVTVQGKVVNELGDPLPGVTVKQKDNTTNGIVTDSKGTYSLTVPATTTVIVFSYIGYETQEFAAKDIVAGSTVTLKASLNNLREVVIDKGYYKERQELSTGDVGVVTAKEIQEQPVFDPIQALIGRVAGLNIQQNSGVPGAYATIIIRGLNSIANGNDPLYIIDGVPFSSGSLSSPSYKFDPLGFGSGSSGVNVNGAKAPGGTSKGGISPFSALNPDDIENIEILKDADATSIYGSRGANGVILITTKKGKAGDTKVSFDVSQGIGQVGHFMDLLNTQQYLAMFHQAYVNDGLQFPSLSTNPGDNHYDLNGIWDTTRNTNWQKTLIGGTAHYTNAQGSISGGSANTQFSIGGGYSRQTTVYPGDFEDRKGSLNFSLNHASANQKFHVQLTGIYVNDNNALPPSDFTNDINFAPDAPALYNPNGSVNWQLYNNSATFNNNPIAAGFNTSTSVTNNLTGNLDLSYQILPGLTLKSDFGYHHDEINQTQLSPNSETYPPPNNTPDGSSITVGNTATSGWIIEPQLNYQKKIANGQLSVLVGGTVEQNTYQSIAQAFYGFTSDALISDLQAASGSQFYGDQQSLYRYNGLYARINYNWEDKYLLNLTANRDGSSRFGPDKQYGNFGAVGAAWLFSKEKIVADNLSWLSFGKLKLSYGTTGNDQIGNYQYLSTYTAYQTPYQGIAPLQPTGLTNPDFRWEIDQKLEGGLDLGFLKDRINLSVNYYRNRTANQLVGYPLPSVTGFNSVQFNLPAVVQNTGWELTLNTVNFKSKDFSWITSANFTAQQNDLISYQGLAGSTYRNLLVIGKSIQIVKGYQYTGINPQTGIYTVATANINGRPSIPQDQIALGPVTQKFYGGVGNNFIYKGLGLDIFLQFVDQVAHGYQQYFASPGGTDNSNEPTAILGAWEAFGQSANVQKYGTTSSTVTSYNNFKASNATITDASFVRVKNIALSYRLPATWQQWARMQNAKIYVQGQNLYTFTKYIGLDPETPGLVLPPLRVVMLGVSATF